MAIAAVANQLVCMVCKPHVQLGMLKAKVRRGVTAKTKRKKERKKPPIDCSRWMPCHRIFMNHCGKSRKATVEG